MEQVHVYIKGKVVGVFFRAWTKEQADFLKITGWVRNVYDNPDVFGENPGVEAVFQGNKERVKHILNLVKQGPPGSKVTDIEVNWEDAKKQFHSFEILH